MGMLLRSFIRLEGSCLKRAFDSLTKDPCSSQRRFLLCIVRQNSTTEYGRDHRFGTIATEKDYQKCVPINTYQDLEPFVEKIMAGSKRVLTADAPFMFNVTSGTTDKPKFIPVTGKTKKRTAQLMHQWLYRCLLDHPTFLDKCSFTITSSAVEGHVACGLPYGSASGLIYKNLPRVMHSSYVLPFAVGDITSYDLRYYTMARLGFEKDVSVIATPNPTTLRKTAETGVTHQEDIVRSIHDGRLLSDLKLESGPGDSDIISSINASLKPNHLRARFLEGIIQEEGKLLPQYCWPSLRLIGCWLGGSIGYQAEKLSASYGNVPKRDIGYLASEGCATLPYEDNTPSGILALPNNFYEFVPEESATDPNPQCLLAHELEQGRQYKVILTNESGLYRYDINDTVRVERFYNQTPVLAFVRKTGDVLNITGEKLHINQLIMALKRTGQEFDFPIVQFRVVSNLKEMRYDILVALGRDIAGDAVGASVVRAIDCHLGEVNIEYAQKRKSKRLNAPCLHIMEPIWEESVKKKLVESGKRDIQYKWCNLSCEFLDLDKPYIKHTIACAE